MTRLTPTLLRPDAHLGLPFPSVGGSFGCTSVLLLPYLYISNGDSILHDAFLHVASPRGTAKPSSRFETRIATIALAPAFDCWTAALDSGSLIAVTTRACRPSQE